MVAKRKLIRFGELVQSSEHTVSQCPERLLCMAILERAVIDCLSKIDRQSVVRSAMDWVFHSGGKEFQFEWICEAVNADPTKVRQIIRSSIESGDQFVQSTFQAKIRFLG